MLERRGPDRTFSCDVVVLNWLLCFKSYVLWMQGSEPTVQPVKDDHGNLLLWNGDIFSGVYEESSVKNKVSDTLVLLQALGENDSSPENILHTMMKVYGPWSMMYWNDKRKTLWFGRDVLGRHSLLWTKSANGIILSSVSKRGCDEEKCQEVPALGLFSMDFGAARTEQEFPVPYLHLWDHLMPANISMADTPVEERILSYPPLDALKVLTVAWLGIECILERFIDLLKTAVKTRVQIQPGLCKDCIKDISKNDEKLRCPHSKICVLFSGGIDSTVLAFLSDFFVPDDEPIDLLNVAFSSGADGSSRNTSRKECCVNKMPDKFQKSIFEVPDRKTGRLAVAELKTLCPNRKWNFVEIDVHISELREIRQGVITDLINPLNTVLDDSLGCAMWFAARGCGTISSPSRPEGKDCENHRVPYSSPARVRNLPSRNLGRDDRICSDHGRQPRFPFLDEDVVSFLNSLAPWQKVAAHVDCRKKKGNERNKQLGVPQIVPLTIRPGVGDKALLRLAALKLGLKEVCSFPKRAMQFGSRIAKLEGKEKANDVSLLGSGADEQLGGYSRHRSALEEGGWLLLAQEMKKQVP
ncbi:hypothetical protein J437_LFUL001018 [Ladona fulva]|uniref:Glutamine amidotransferase type-2 domain-containing protein n=1 Tax=Ladona fulva TaxID=123851 RepID=A0A8K0KFM9_LADFU|nr:hypothetical protein J437_LFUL001018 [Ladona fulva]